MIAKLIVWDEDRERACARMLRALAQYRVVGVANNVAFLSRLVACPAFASADLDTGLIERERGFLFPGAGRRRPARSLRWRRSRSCCANRSRRSARPPAGEDPHSPWHQRDGWRLNSGFSRTLKFRAGSQEKAIRRHLHAGPLLYSRCGRRPDPGTGPARPNGALRAEFGGRRLSATVIVAGEKRHVFLYGRSHLLAAVDPLYQPGEGAGAESRLTAPMPGRIIALLAEPGKVEKGAPLLIMEAMKMEHTIRAPAAGLFKGFRYAVGDQVGEGADLVDFEPHAGDARREPDPEAV